MTDQGVPSRAQGRHAGLTRAAVLDAAMELIDRDGLAQFSMRRLGAALGVEAMTLYHHVGNKEELLDGLVERLFDDVVPDLPEDVGWQEALRVIAHDLRARLLAHPHLVPVVATRPAVTPTTLRTVERGLEALRPAGFGPAQSLEVVYAVVGLVLGQVGMEVAAGNDTAAERVQRLGTWNLDDLPLLQQAAQEASGLQARSTFDLSLDAMIAGLDVRPPDAEHHHAGEDEQRRSR